jgi:hypothetical protein
VIWPASAAGGSRKVVARVEPAYGEALDQEAQDRGQADGAQDAQGEATALAGEPGREVGAHHVERAVGEVDDVHDTEHEREPGRHQEEGDAELEAVEGLLEEEGGHPLRRVRAGSGRRSA